MPHPRPVLLAALCVCALTFVTGCSPAAQTSGDPTQFARAFDGERAYELLKKQVEFGPRVPGTEAHDACAKFISSSLKPYGCRVNVQEFSRTVSGKTVRMKNIVAHFGHTTGKWVLLAAHWDSRPMADCEVNAAKRKQAIPGANDGASGVAVLLELARMFGRHKPNVGVVMVFFDGEDYGQTSSDMFLGSTEFASDVAKNAGIDGKPIKIDYGILLDMVGDKDLRVCQEMNSLQAAREVVEKVWRKAEDLGYGKIFMPEMKYSISDDHIPLIRAGVECIDVIDFEYGPWHTLDDTPDKCSADSLKAVGQVTAAVVYTERP